MRCKNQKTSNHQGVFAFIILRFPELELDWGLLERIRTLRNENKYRGADVTQQMWKSIELPFQVYCSTVLQEIRKKIEER